MEGKRRGICFAKRSLLRSEGTFPMFAFSITVATERRRSEFGLPARVAIVGRVFHRAPYPPGSNFFAYSIKNVLVNWLDPKGNAASFRFGLALFLRYRPGSGPGSAATGRKPTEWYT